MSNFCLIAHRGFSSQAPENTLQAFDMALAAGFSHFETDVQLSSDVVCCIVHDENLGRVNDGCGKVSDLSALELGQLDAGSWFAAQFAGLRIPTLREILERYGGVWGLPIQPSPRSHQYAPALQSCSPA